MPGIGRRVASLPFVSPNFGERRGKDGGRHRDDPKSEHEDKESQEKKVWMRPAEVTWLRDRLGSNWEDGDVAHAHHPHRGRPRRRVGYPGQTSGSNVTPPILRPPTGFAWRRAGEP